MIVIALLLLVLVIARALKGASTTLPATYPSVPTITQTTTRAESASREHAAASGERGRGPVQWARMMLSAMKEQLRLLQKQFASFTEASTTAVAQLKKNTERKVPARDEAKSKDLVQRAPGTQPTEGNLCPAIGQLDAKLSAAMAAECTQRIRGAQTLNDSLSKHARRSSQEAELVMIAIGAIASLVIIGRILMEKRIRDIEQGMLFPLSEGKRTGTEMRAAAMGPAAALRRGKMATAGKALSAVLARPPEPVIPSPTQQVALLIRQAKAFRHIKVKPISVSSSWSMGLATAQGNVRSRNEDYGLAFRIRGHDVLLLADGLGGVPHGSKASHTAAVSAAKSVIRAYGMAPRWFVPHVKDVAAKAVLDAARRLTIEGNKMNLSARDGLRTTLIVIVASDREFGYAYIGDGGGYILRASGDVCRFLHPQKANEFAANILAASLGPSMEGEPVVGVLPRYPGDFLIAGTDGVFDRVADAFVKDVLRGAIERDGDLQATAEQVVAELAAFKDDAGYACDDNLTLGVMSDGSAPKLPRGFWTPADENVPDGLASPDPLRP